MQKKYLNNELPNNDSLTSPKVSVFWFFWFVSSPNAGKHGPEKHRIRTLSTQCTAGAKSRPLQTMLVESCAIIVNGQDNSLMV